MPQTKKTKTSAATEPLTYPRRLTHPMYMGCGGPGKPVRVIDAGKVLFYVGIGWIDEGPATEADRQKYPVLVD